MRWAAPPDRREITLVVFCISAFTLAFNFEASFRYLGFDSSKTHAVLGRFGMGQFSAVGDDGRKLPVYRDALEKKIYGTWAWDAGFIAGNGAERSQELGTGKHGAMWLSHKEIGDLRSDRLGQHSINDGFLRWGKDIPKTELLKHSPGMCCMLFSLQYHKLHSGYTVLDNVFIKNGSVYIVTDKPHSFPPIDSISVGDAGLNKWRFISTFQARTEIGSYGGIIHDASWMSTDLVPHNSTLVSLWRTYSALDPDISASGATILPPPRRLIFPNNRFFTDANPDFNDHWIPRRRVDTGFHPFLAKAAFPTMTELYYEDWEDFHQMEVPFMFERLVIADRACAARAVEQHQPIFTPAFRHPVSPHWWEPIRKALAVYFDASDESRDKIVTYIDRQHQPHGSKMRQEDHDELVGALKQLAGRHGYEVNIVSSLDEQTDWRVRMNAIVRSTIVIGVQNDELLDAIYVKPSPHATVMEFFAPDTFCRDRQLVADALHINYLAWWKSRKFATDSLPVVTPPSDQDVSIDVPAIISAIQDILER
ncbi:hypothetical protein C8J56DRAFT_180699 [Mycena floridula]|nr:hypothetical protein C8J56DRAFT_180699 [Mycena floridula]